MFILVCYAMRVQSLINNIFNIFMLVGFFFQFKNKIQMAEKKVKNYLLCVCVCVNLYKFKLKSLVLWHTFMFPATAELPYI